MTAGTHAELDHNRYYVVFPNISVSNMSASRIAWFGSFASFAGIESIRWPVAVSRTNIQYETPPTSAKNARIP